MAEFLIALSLTERLLLATLLGAYVLVSLAAIAFQDGQEVGPETPRGGRHREGAPRPALTKPPREPSWLGGDESQGWWIWRDDA